ncbi:Protein diaphanous [Papilio machaon]|uniref:Protein diaphanous n=1 Tax=Papilio machaon TaxID=76193 RepID=A0A0N1IQ25_PAPMA|nr:Protein diaphanous [Papilio machaon]
MDTIKVVGEFVRERSPFSLDTWFGRPKKTGGGIERGYDTVPRGAEPRAEDDEPSAAAEYTNKIDALDDNQLQRRFEEMLTDMNISEEKKEPLRKYSRDQKKKMLVAYKFVNAQLSVGKLHGCLENLRIALTNNPLSWIQEFGTKGIESLLSTLNICYTNDARYDRVQYECIRCLSAILNNTVGIRTVFECREALPVLARSLDARKPHCALEAAKVLAAICLIPNGHEKVLEAITMAGESSRRPRLLPIVECLDSKSPESLKNGCMQLMNAIITEPEELEFRMHLRSEFMRTGLYDLIDELRAAAEGARQIQMNVFDTHASADQDEFLAKFDDEGRSKFEKPSDYVSYLNQPELSVGKLHGCLENLRIALTNNPLSWIQEFGTKGIESLLSTLNICYTNDARYDRVQYECIRCLSAILNNTVGIRTVFECREALPVLARSLDARKPHCALEAAKVLAAICLIPNGHEKVLEAITMAGESSRRPRLLPIVECLDSKSPESLKNGCMQLMNAIITEPEELEFRMHLRSEFMRTGLYDLIDELRAAAEGARQIQMNVFDTHASADQDEFLAKFDDVRVDFNDANECFELVKNLVMDTPAEPYLLSILQHLLFIRDDELIRPAYYKLIEECVTQIVLHKNGYDPDFRATQRFNIDVQPLIDGLIDLYRYKSGRWWLRVVMWLISKNIRVPLAVTRHVGTLCYERHTNSTDTRRSICDVRDILNVAITIKCGLEAEARAAHLEDRLKQAATPTGPGGVSQGNIAAIAKAIGSPGGPPPPPPPPMPGGNFLCF